MSKWGFERGLLRKLSKEPLNKVISHLDVEDVSALPLDRFALVDFAHLKNGWSYHLFARDGEEQRLSRLDENQVQVVFDSLRTDQIERAPLRLFQKLKFEDFDPKNYPRLFDERFYQNRLKALSDPQLEKVFSGYQSFRPAIGRLDFLRECLLISWQLKKIIPPFLKTGGKIHLQPFTLDRDSYSPSEEQKAKIPISPRPKSVPQKAL